MLLPGCAATALPMARLYVGHLGQQELGSVQVKESIPHMGMLDRPDYLHFSQQEASVRPVRPPLCLDCPEWYSPDSLEDLQLRKDRTPF